MSPIQQMLLGVGAVAKKTYMDDVFSTYLTTGNATARSVNTGVDMTEGGLIWSKCRTDSHSHFLFDTERGVNKFLRADGHNAEYEESGSLTAFNNNGFSLGTWSGVNQNSADHAHFSFRKAKGFFDIVTYTGTGSDRTIAHSLGSVPGMILVKNLSDSNENWVVYHNHLNGGDNAEEYFLQLNSSLQRSDSDIWGDTTPTGSVFSVGSNVKVNGNNKNYVAYIFAGGESTAGNARSGVFSGTNDRLYMDGGSDFQFGTGDFTIECWAKPDTITQSGVFQLSAATGGLSTGGIAAALGGDNKWKLGYGNLTQLSGGSATKGQWHHLAYVRHSGVSKLYINGTAEISVSDTTNYTYDNLVVGGYYSTSYLFDGCISNLRVVKGTAVYTSSFKPPTEPLANITGTVLLSVGVDSNIVDRTVSPTTWNIEGNPGIDSTNSPFDDSAGFVFGENGDQNVIKTGSYVGTGGSGVGPVINLGWEPQWLLVKMSDSASGGQWYITDTMRGWGADNSDNGPATFSANSSGTEEDWGQYNYDLWTVNPTGFTVGPTDRYNVNNTADKRFIWMAIRRPDGYVGKPPELGSEVFSMNSGANSGAPLFDSTHVVDYQFVRKITATWNWETGARLLGPKQVYLNKTNTETNIDPSGWKYDYMNGWHSNASGISNYMCWMWKRGAGFDVLTYEGLGFSGQQVPHGLNAVPEMMWVKRRDGAARDWQIYHKGLNGGTNPEQYKLLLNTNAAEAASTTAWSSTAPTSNAISLGHSSDVNGDGSYYIAMLFSSTDVSKVGYYTGNGSSTGPVITTGFTPRFILFKNASSGGNGWLVLDTERGLGTSSQDRIWLDWDEQENAGGSGSNFVTTTSTSFQPVQNNTEINENGSTILYYAHA